MNKARKMYLIISIAIGGAIGATSRYIISTAIQNLSSNAFPYGMLACNVLGSLILGILYDSLAKDGIFTSNIARNILRTALIILFMIMIQDKYVKDAVMKIVKNSNMVSKNVRDAIPLILISLVVFTVVSFL